MQFLDNLLYSACTHSRWLPSPGSVSRPSRPSLCNWYLDVNHFQIQRKIELLVSSTFTTTSSSSTSLTDYAGPQSARRCPGEWIAAAFLWSKPPKLGQNCKNSQIGVKNEKRSQTILSRCHLFSIQLEVVVNVWKIEKKTWWKQNTIPPFLVQVFTWILLPPCDKRSNYCRIRMSGTLPRCQMVCRWQWFWI